MAAAIARMAGGERVGWGCEGEWADGAAGMGGVGVRGRSVERRRRGFGMVVGWDGGGRRDEDGFVVAEMGVVSPVEW